MSGEFAQYGRALIELGYRPIPIYPGRKNPSIVDWQNAHLTVADHERMSTNGHMNDGLGLVCGQGEVPIHMVDIDVLDPDVSLLMRQYVDDLVGLGIERVGKAPKVGLIYRGSGFTKIQSKVFEDAEGRRHKVEILGNGQQFVLGGIHPDTGKPYEHGDWQDRKLWELEFSDLPEITTDHCLAIVGHFNFLAEEAGWTEVKTAKRGAHGPAQVADEDYIPNPPVQMGAAEIEEVCSHWPVEEYDDVIWLGQALHHQFEGSDDGLVLWDKMGSKAAKYLGFDWYQEKWNTFGVSGRKSVTLRAMIKHANEVRPKEQAKAAEVVVDATQEAKDQIQWAVDMCDSSVELLGPVAVSVSEILGKFPILRPFAEGQIRARYKDLEPQAARLNAREMRNVLRPPGRADQGERAANDRLLVEPEDPSATGRRLLAREYTWDVDGKSVLLKWWGSEWWYWADTHYRLVEGSEMEAKIWKHMEAGITPGENGIEDYRPRMAHHRELVHALHQVAELPTRKRPPMWLTKGNDLNPHNLLPVHNGLLKITENEIIPHTPDFWVQYSLPYDVDPTDTSAPVEWFKFLESVWPGDQETWQALGEAIGYTLMPDHSQQKLFALIGAPRAGKGVISKVWAALMGADNVANPQFSSLATNFGLQNLIGKPLAIIQDARISGKVDTGILLERLLAISAGDTITVDRKNKEPWNGVLQSRIVMVSNKIPHIRDGGSGALLTRIIAFHFRESYADREDRGLYGRLEHELPAILRWALRCRQDYLARGRLLRPKSGEDIIEDWKYTLSLESAFVDSTCELGDGKMIRLDKLYEAWRTWCHTQGEAHTSSLQSFAKGLHAAFPGLKSKRGTARNDRNHHYVFGIALADVASDDDDFFD